MTDENAFRPVDFDPFVPASERVAPLPLTEAQAELWTATAMGREANCSYNQCFAFELRGPLRVESLRVALDGVVRRHEALRTVIAPDGASQTVQPPFAVELPLVDVSELGSDERGHELERLLDLECETPFDLATGPLLRAFVLREGADAHRFVLTVHHIVCDGWSSSVLFSDLGRLYEADCVGIPAQLDPAASYREHLAAEASDDARAAEEADEEYWAAQFDEGTPVLDLPVRARPALKTYRSGREELRIDPELYAALKKTGARSGATLFATLVAAYDVLLSRLSGQTDLVVGIPFAGQPRLDNPDLVAHCVNTVPLRVRVEPDASFDDHLKRVGVDLAEAQEHALVTFGSLVRRLQLARDPARTPLVETTFAIDRIGAPFDFGDVEIVSVRTPRSFSNFEIQVNAVDSGSDLLLEWDYNADLFSQQTARRWLSHYETLLRAIVARSDAPVRALPLLTQEERESLLSAPALSEQVEGTLHGRFFEQARRTPDAIALTCGDDSVSYGELARRARVLAGHLRTLGVGRDVLVGLRAERSNELVIGILGILAAGGAYLPLDPAYPRERVEFMLEDASVSVVVAERAFADDVVGERPHGRPPRRGFGRLVRGGRGLGRRRRARLLHVHVGLHGQAQGRTRHARQRPSPLLLDRRVVSIFRARRVDALPLVRLRLLGLGAVGSTAARRAPRRRSLLGEPLARGVSCARRRRGSHRPQPDALCIPAAAASRRERWGGREHGPEVRDLRRRGAGAPESATVVRAPR